MKMKVSKSQLFAFLLIYITLYGKLHQMFNVLYLKLKLTTKKRFSIFIMHDYFEDPLLIPGLNFVA